MTRESMLSAFDKAELLLAEKADAEIENAEPVSFSLAFERRMKRVCERMNQGKTPVVSTTLKILLIAAIIALLSACAFGALKLYDYYMLQYPDHAEYVQPDADYVTYVEPLKIRHKPRGYNLKNVENAPLFSMAQYENKTGDFIYFEKVPANSSFGLDNEYTEVYKVERSGVTYYVGHTVAPESSECKSLIAYADKKYLFSIYTSEVMSDDELIRLARSMS